MSLTENSQVFLVHQNGVVSYGELFEKATEFQIKLKHVCL